MPTTQRQVLKNISLISAQSDKLGFIVTTQLEIFINNINAIRGCKTPGCDGKLVNSHVRSNGLGGALVVTFACNGCGKCVLFQTSATCEGINTSEIGIALQVAFIVAGFTHSTYFKVMKHALGIDVFSMETFLSTIQRMFPIVEAMLNEMCDMSKEMKKIEEGKLGSWKRAVTVADGTWWTRGWHSKNATFSIRKKNSGDLLYYKHLCQKAEIALYKKSSTKAHPNQQKVMEHASPSEKPKRRECKLPYIGKMQILLLQMLLLKFFLKRKL